jgi:hypothetical protein
MGITVDWYDETDHSILCWTFDGRWDWSHLQAAAKETKRRAAYSEQLNLILDVHQMGLVPMNIASGLRRMRNTDQSFRGGGINVIVGADYYLKLLWQFMSPDFPPQWTLHFVETYDEALRLIKDARAVVERV